MKKFLSAVISILILLCFASCGGNTVVFKFGDAELVPNKAVKITQTKEKIENGKLVFYKGKNNYYENIYLNYSGNNIKNLKAQNDSKTLYLLNHSCYVRGLDVFDFYYKPDNVTENYDAERDFENRWDNGEFDDIKNVYFSGQSIYELTRNKKSYNLDGGVLSSADFNNTSVLVGDIWYVDEVKKPTGDIVEISLMSYHGDDGEKDDKTVVQSNPIVSSNNEGEFIYRYEKLFYNAKQKSYSYSYLKGEKIPITVTYNNGSQESFLLKISFDNQGNIIAKLNGGK